MTWMKVQRSATETKRLTHPSIIEESNRWRSFLLARVEVCLEEEKPGHVCITTPEGRACRVTVWFGPGGKA
jgi:hypothetical protein